MANGNNDTHKWLRDAAEEVIPLEKPELTEERKEFLKRKLKTDPISAAVHSLGREATYQWGDEGVAAFKAMKDIMGSEYTMKDYKPLYNKYLEEARAQAKEEKELYPGAVKAGEILSYAIPDPLSKISKLSKLGKLMKGESTAAKAGKMAAGGAAGAAIESAGAQEEFDAAKTFLDATLGGASAGVLGTATHKIANRPKKIEKLEDDLVGAGHRVLGINGAAAKGLKKEGVDVDGVIQAVTAEDLFKKKGLAKDYVKTVKELKKKTDKEYSDFLKELDKKVEVNSGDIIDNTISSMKKDLEVTSLPKHLTYKLNTLNDKANRYKQLAAKARKPENRARYENMKNMAEMEASNLKKYGPNADKIPELDQLEIDMKSNIKGNSFTDFLTVKKYLGNQIGKWNKEQKEGTSKGMLQEAMRSLQNELDNAVGLANEVSKISPDMYKSLRKQWQQNKVMADLMDKRLRDTYNNAGPAAGNAFQKMGSILDAFRHKTIGIIAGRKDIKPSMPKAVEEVMSLNKKLNRARQAGGETAIKAGKGTSSLTREEE